MVKFLSEMNHALSYIYLIVQNIFGTLVNLPLAGRRTRARLFQGEDLVHQDLLEKACTCIIKYTNFSIK